jgi:quinol-cytochrome oxidoreductase complex cytochrome b subunit/NADH:ubiquinone oxidoreductase subunit 2 (subunit N)
MSLYAKLLKNPLVSTVSNHIDTYPTPINLTYLWGFGSLAGMALVTQIVTGVLLAMHYAAEIHIAFASVEHIMRDVKGGVYLRYIHANGASMFLLIVYIHMFRGLYYGSYYQPRANLWYSGVVIFLAMMATAFMGYVLPWGQMSFWGATVITNLFSAVPYIGDSIVQLLWGGFSVDNPTLNRFFSLHYFVPFIIAGLAGLHLILLHQPGSNNPLGINSIYDRVPFYPYFYVKDLFGFFIFVWIFSFFVVYAPNYLGHPDNYIEANPLVTPAHIVPEWYFLPFYAILRSIPDKLGGVVLMVTAIVILALLPVVDTSAFRSNYFKPLNIWMFWFFFADSISLGWIGQEIVETPYIEMGVFVTVVYFLYFLLFLPLAGFIENSVIKNVLKVNLNYASMGASALPLSSIGVMPRGALDTTNFVSNKDSEIFGFTTFDKVFAHFFEWVGFYQVAFVALFLLGLSLFFPRTGEFTRFTNKLGFGYLLLIFWLTSFQLYFYKYVTAPTLPEKVIFFMETKIQYTSWQHMYDVMIKNWQASGLNMYALFEGETLFAKIFFVYALFIVSIFLYGIADRFFVANSYEIEFSLLVFFIHLGALFLFSVSHVIEFVLAIEIVTLATYTLTAFDRKNRFSAEAGVQYFILGSLPSGLLVLGTALLYKSWGTLGFADLDLLLTDTTQQSEFSEPVKHVKKHTKYIAFVRYHPYLEEVLYLPVPRPVMYSHYDIIKQESLYGVDTKEFFPEFEVLYASATPYAYATLAAIFLIFFNFLFKLTAAPFHFWAPTIYGKAPLASVTFLSIFSKGMIFFALTKFLFTLFHAYFYILLPFLIFVSVLSVLFGMIGAFAEKGIKRFFVYSSMGHVGFMLLGLSLSTREGLSATFHYLPVYIITSFIMWFILLDLGEEKNELVHFSVLKNSNSLLALIFSLIIFSMSGIPPLGGFFVKLDILAALIESSRFYTNLLLLFFTVASFFYYLRVIKIIFFDNSNDFESNPNRSEERLWMISVLFIILLFYLFLVEKPLLEIQMQALSAIL